MKRAKLKPPNKTSIEKSPVNTVKKYPLKCVIKNLLIEDAVLRVNKIVIQTYQFLKLYFIHLMDNNKPLPTINSVFIETIMRIVSKKKDSRGKPSSDNTKKLIIDLTNFYKKYFRPNLKKCDIVKSTKINTPLKYEATCIITSISNNISLHYIDHVYKFVNVMFDVKSQIKQINSKISDNNKKQMRKIINDIHREIKNDLINITNTPPNAINKSFIEQYKLFIIPKKIFRKNNLFYDIKANPLDYIGGMIYMSKQIELVNERILLESHMNKIICDIKTHYCNHVNRFVNVMYDVKTQLNQINDSDISDDAKNRSTISMKRI